MSKKVTKSYSSNFVKATFSGNLPYDPNLTSFNTKSGKTVNIVYFRILSDDYYNGYQTTSDMQCIAFGQKAIDIANNFKAGDFVEAQSTINTYPTKTIQGKTFKYPVTITRFNVYKLKDLRKSNKPKDKTAKQSAPKDSKAEPKTNPKPKNTKPVKKSSDKKPSKNGDTTKVTAGDKKIDISDDDLPF